MPAPTLTGFAPSITLDENTVNATPQLLDADVSFSDVDGDFDGGVLTLTGLLAEDRVSVRNQGTGAGQIGLSGTNVTFGGVVIGSLAGGVGGTLTITFNAAATSAAIEALIENLTYANVSQTPTASRTLRLDVRDASGQGMGGGETSYSLAAGAANPFNGINQGVRVAPTLVDLDGDGDFDLVTANNYGIVRTFRNDAGVFTELTGGDNPLEGAGGGSINSAPAFADLDGDGDLDMIAGQGSPYLLAFRNDGGVFN